MRVLFLTNADVHQYGIAEALQGLSAALLRQRASVVCYSSDPSAKFSPLANGTPVEFGPLPAPRFFPSASDVKPLLRLCRRERIDVIHCHNVYRPGWAARLVKRALGIPYVLTSHNDLNRHTSERIRRFWVRRRCRAILRDAAMITHFNEFMADNARAIGDVESKSVIIPNGLDVDFWRDDDSSPRSSRMVLALGRLVKDKGFDTLIAAAAILKTRDRPVSLVIAGAGPELGNLIAQARQSGLAVREGGVSDESFTVSFPGVATGAAKRRLFARSRFVAFPSHPNSESFGLVVLEAMAAARPVLASDIASVREILGTGSPQLTPSRDPTAWATAMGRWLGDDVLCRSLGESNRAASAYYGWDRVAAQYLNVYEAALARTPARPPASREWTGHFTVKEGTP